MWQIATLRKYCRMICILIVIVRYRNEYIYRFRVVRKIVNPAHGCLGDKLIYRENIKDGDITISSMYNFDVFTRYLYDPK